LGVWLEEVVLVDGLSIPLVDEFWGPVGGEDQQGYSLVVGFAKGGV